MARVEVTEFTDPYCTWCWGAEPIVRRLREVYRDQLSIGYVMGGLFEDFDHFSDPAGRTASETDIASHWQAASGQHGMPVDVSLWDADPPDSTYPACVAYEAATFQGEGLASDFLRRMREAGAAEGANLCRTSVLVGLATEVGLAGDRFREDLNSDAAREAFAEDRRTARRHGATSFPTFEIEVGDRREYLRGYRPFQAFEKLFAEASVDLERHEPRPVPALVDHYGRVATQEVAEIHGLEPATTRERLRELAADDRIRAVEAGNDYFWEPT